MPNPTLVLIHGMGTHSQDTFQEKEVIPTLSKAYEILTGDTGFANKVTPLFINYSDLLDKIRKKIADASFDDVNFPGNLAQIANVVNGIGRDFSEDSFFYTHWMDVILYKTHLTHAVQVHVATQLLAVLKQHKAYNVHLLCHSLGTAVMHDVLHKLYINDFQEDVGENLLSAGHNNLASISMIANVSQIVGMTVPSDNSVIRPGPGGMCKHFLNARHVLDPFSSILRFKPSWENDVGYKYSDPVINEVEEILSVHDVDHYLANPDVHIPLFRRLFPDFRTTDASLQKAYAEHRKTTTQGKFEQLKKELKDAEFTVKWNEQTGEFEFSDSINDVQLALVAFMDHLKKQYPMETGDNQ